MTAYVTDVCPRCGSLKSECSDPNRLWYPQRTMCYSSAAEALTRRRIEAKVRKDEPGTDELHPVDGLHVWMAPDDLTPDDDFGGLLPSSPSGGEGIVSGVESLTGDGE